MPLRFFADHCVPGAVIQSLRNTGHEVFILKQHIPQDSDDPVVIGKAQELDAVLVSLNGDFADIVTYPPSTYKGIIALQVRNHPEVIPALMQRLLGYLSARPEMGDHKGRLLVVEAHRIRIRRQRLSPADELTGAEKQERHPSLSTFAHSDRRYSTRASRSSDDKCDVAPCRSPALNFVKTSCSVAASPV